MNALRRPFFITRREFLTTAGAGATAVALNGCSLFPQTTGTQGTMSPLPSFPRAASTGRVREYTLEAAPMNITLGGQHITTWGYNGGLPGPEIRITEGDTLRVTVKNRLPEGTTVHWHGVPLVNKMDGVPCVTQPDINSGQDFTYEFLAPTAGTYMYHSHSGLQLDRGLYGPLIIEPTKETQHYDQDFVLVLDDWLDGMPGTPEDAMKQLIAGGDRMDNMNGGMGNMQVAPDIIYPLYLINGMPSTSPVALQVTQGQKVRIRLINAGASTIFRVALQGHRMTVTHTDGQAVEPVAAPHGSNT